MSCAVLNNKYTPKKKLSNAGSFTAMLVIKVGTLPQAMTLLSQPVILIRATIFQISSEQVCPTAYIQVCARSFLSETCFLTERMPIEDSLYHISAHSGLSGHPLVG